MGVDMSNNNNNNQDLFASPALSLSLAGIFRGGTAAEKSGEVEEGEEGSGGKREETVEISSENSGPARSRSEDAEYMMNIGEDEDEDGDGDDDGGGGGDEKGKKKRRKKYHRHTTEQIREMEALFKESPHPDEKQRQQLSKQLGLHPRQVKFWFQNRRTQIKAIQERHENSLLKTELEKLKDENKSLRECIHRSSCPNCGFATTIGDPTLAADGQQQLKLENARLKAEVEKLKAMVGPGTVSQSATCTTSDDQDNRSAALDSYTGVFGIDKEKITEAVKNALEELNKMAASGEPLWVKSVETGREILNYDEYLREFCCVESSSGGRSRRSIEASRESGVVFVDLPRLVHSFMDVNQWKEMFPSLISKAAVVDVICNGEDPNKNGSIQLMYAELQMLTPMVPTREVYFVRCCKQLSPEQWAIVDVSIDKLEDNIDASLIKCRKRPSGCIIEDQSSGHCKVTWVEHMECQKTTVHSLYRSMVNSGVAFGARHWMSTLQLQCERLVFLMATNVPTKDSSGVATLAGRKSILNLAQRMTCSFCRALGASSFNAWTKVTTKSGDDVRVASRKNMNNPGEPIGVILCAVFSVWLPVSPTTLFDFLRDDAQRHEWDVMATACQVQSVANLSKGQDRGNAVSIQTLKSKETMTWVLQDSTTNTYESMVVYAPIDTSSIQSVMTGCDSSNVAVLPSGFSILPDGMESRSLVLTSRQDEKNADGGSLLTIAIQVVTNGSPAARLTAESVEPVSSLISCVVGNIKRSLHCEDG